MPDTLLKLINKLLSYKYLHDIYKYTPNKIAKSTGTTVLSLFIHAYFVSSKIYSLISAKVSAILKLYEWCRAKDSTYLGRGPTRLGLRIGGGHSLFVPGKNGNALLSQVVAHPDSEIAMEGTPQILNNHT